MFPPSWLPHTSVWRCEEDWATSEGPRLPGWPTCSGGDGNKERLCAHTLTLTRTCTRPTQALSKNISSSLVAKIKEPLGGRPPGGNIAPWPLLFKGLCEISRLLLEGIPGRGGGFPQLETWARMAQPPALAGGGKPQGPGSESLAAV